MRGWPSARGGCLIDSGVEARWPRSRRGERQHDRVAVRACGRGPVGYSVWAATAQLAIIFGERFTEARNGMTPRTQNC